MKWIDIKGSLGEQMLRYTLALSMNNKGDGVGVTCANEKLFATFPSLPRLQLKRISLADRIGRPPSRSGFQLFSVVTNRAAPNGVSTTGTLVTH